MTAPAHCTYHFDIAVRASLRHRRATDHERRAAANLHEYSVEIDRPDAGPDKHAFASDHAGQCSIAIDGESYAGTAIPFTKY
jgi:hypothetical protein